ncbi:MAG: hypothetical protein GIW95_11860, partial [Candidatus Eremiobacteraeota bacterium]|nr:hypothetical protein [Candidatus Eremiobacteraeota bacterium]
LLRASLLVHDVGHGPFSHASEHVLGVRHEERTRAILDLPEMRAALDGLDVDANDVLELVAGEGANRYPVLKELVSGPNLDADRMDYLLRDSYFTGVTNGRYDAEQLTISFRIFEQNGKPALGIDGRGIVALESFVIARYMMFATVYFHHTTRMFERLLNEALEEVWPDPRALEDVSEFLAWDDFRVLEALRSAPGAAAAALRSRDILYVVAAEFNAARDLTRFERCFDALRRRYGDAVWADSQEQLLHRLPLGSDGSEPTILVATDSGLVDAREASDLISRLSGKAYWRKLFVAKAAAPAAEVRALCRRVADGGEAA